MLNKIIAFSLRNRPLILLATLLLLIGGCWTAWHSEVDVFPDLNAPTVVVMTEAKGMAAEEVERLVTFPIETAVNGATDVRRVRSSSTAGFSVVWVEFDWGTDVYRDRQIVSEKLATVSDAMPEGVSSPTLGPQSSILGEVLFIGLTADSTSMSELRTLADWVVRPHLLSVGGVAQVSVIGGDVQEYQIQVHPERLRHFGVTLTEVLDAAQGMTRNATGGTLYEYGNEYIVRGLLSTASIDDMSQAVVCLSPQGQPITLADVADVQLGIKSPRMGIASISGRKGVLLTVTKQPATGTLDLTTRLDTAMSQLRASLPKDVKVNTQLYRQEKFINSSISNIRKSLLEGGIFVVLVLFVFLMNGRTTIISLVTIPLSLLITIIVLKLMGLTVNTMSIGGMAIAIGSLVDDAIVDVENVYKRLRQNFKKPASERRALLSVVHDASCEVRMPILNSTLIIVVSFVPLFFLSGLEGRMLTSLGVAFIVSLFASTLVALTLTPVLCSYLLGQKGGRHGEPRYVRRLRAAYGRILGRLLHHSRAALLCVVALLAFTVVGFLALGRSFLPPFNEGSFTINVSTLPGISIAESDSIGRRTEQLLLDVPEVDNVARKTGRAELDEHAQGVNSSELEVPFTLAERSKDEVVADIRQRLSTLSGVNVEIGQPVSHRIDAMLSGTKANVAIKIFGADLGKLHAIGMDIKRAIADVEGVADLNVEQQVERPQLVIRPRRTLLAQHGITLPDFARYVNAALGGEVVSQVMENGRSFGLTVRMSEEDRTTIEDIRNAYISTANGGQVPLSDVANIVSTTGPSTISRENAQRKLVVSANVVGRDLHSVVGDIRSRIAAHIDLPEGYSVTYGGQFESEQSASRTLFALSLCAVVVILLLLFIQFRSWRQAVVVLLNLPLALAGGVAMLVVTGSDVSIPAIIGFISLFGIATRGGMLLVDRYNELAHEGVPLRESVLFGSTDRLLPILMTSFASALALIPLAVGYDLPGNEIQSPMAQVMLGGLLTSTLLNLVIIPIMYYKTNKLKPTASLSAFGGATPLPSEREEKRQTSSTAKSSATGNLSIVVILSLVLCTLSASESKAQSRLALLDTILQNNTTLSALRSQMQANILANRAEQRLADPDVDLAYYWGSPSGIPARKNIDVSQTFDWGTLLGRRHTVTMAATRRLESEYATARQAVLAEADAAIVQLTYANAHCAELRRRELQAQADLILSERSYAEGALTQIALHKAQLNAAVVAAESRRAENERLNALAEVEQLAGGRAVNYTDTAYLAPPLPTLAEVNAALEEQNPQLIAADAAIAEQRARLNLAKALTVPSLKVGFSGEYIRGQNYSGLSLGFSLPLWGGSQAIRRQSRAALVSAQLERDDKARHIFSDASRRYGEALRLQQVADTLRAALDSTDNAALLRRALEAGHISMPDYLLEVAFYNNARTAWLEAQRDAWLARSAVFALIAR